MKTVKLIASTIPVFALLVLTTCKDNPVGVNRQDAVVQTIITETNLDSLTLSVQTLTGEVSITIDGASQMIESRHKDYPGNDMAADYIEQKLVRYGLQVTNDYFNESGRSVVATQPGARYPDRAYIICAHYDCYPISDEAPGADDNASGTAAVLEAARLLSQYETDYSVIYALWDEEEQGLVGSRHYAANARESSAAILGVINLDMIGWDSDDDGTVLIDINEMPGSLELSERVIEIGAEYQIELTSQSFSTIGRSDHVSFWQQGYAAIMIIEDFSMDWNTHYHTPTDRVEHLNLGYYHHCVQLAIGTLASLVM